MKLLTPQGGGMKMNHTRSIGVAEARVGLTVLTCLLVALGYVVLQKLGGTGQTPQIEDRPINIVGPFAIEPPKANKPEQPEVMKLEGPDLPSQVVPRTTLGPNDNGLNNSRR